MFTRLFKSHTNIQILILLIGSILLWSDGFFRIQSPNPENGLSPLFELLFNWTIEPVWAGAIIAFLLLLCEAFLLNQIVSMEGITPRNSYLPAALYMLLFSYIPQMLFLHPAIPANLMLILAVWMVIKSRHHDKSYQKTFTAALLFALASLFNIYYLVFFPLIWFAMIIFRSLSWREWTISFLGMITPYIYLAFIYFWNDCLFEKIEAYKSFFQSIRIFNASYAQAIMVYIVWVEIALLVIFSVLSFVTKIPKKIISLRKISMIIVWLFLLSLCLIPLIQENFYLMGSVLFIPASVFVSSWMMGAKRAYISEILIWLMIGSIIAGKMLL